MNSSGMLFKYTIHHVFPEGLPDQGFILAYQRFHLARLRHASYLVVASLVITDDPGLSQ